MVKDADARLGCRSAGFRQVSRETECSAARRRASDVASLFLSRLHTPPTPTTSPHPTR